MTDHDLELVLDGRLTRSEVEAVIRARAESDRRTLGNAYDAGGWNTLAVVFDHRHFFDVVGVRDARTRIADRLGLGIGAAVHVLNDAGLFPTRDPERREARSTLTVAPTALAPTAVQPDIPPPAEADAFDVMMAQAVTDRRAAFEATPEGEALRQQREQVEAKMQGFAPDIIQRLAGNSSKTRGCAECGSSIAVTHIKASQGDDGFTTIRCPVCDADRFCVFDTDLKRREAVARAHQKAVRLYDEGLAAFGSDAPPHATIEEDPEDPMTEAAEAVLAEPVEDEPVVAAMIDTAPEPESQIPPDSVWIIGGRVPSKAEAA